MSLVLVSYETFFTLLLGSRIASTSRLILTIYTSYDVFPCKEVPFESLFDIEPHVMGQMSPKPPFSPMTLTYNPRLAKVEVELRAKNQGQRSNGSNWRVPTDKRTDGRY